MVQFTCTFVLPVTAVEVSDVPAVDANVSVAALIVHDAVMVIETVKFAVAVPACAVAAANMKAVKAAAIDSAARMIGNMSGCLFWFRKTETGATKWSQTIQNQ